MSRLLFALPLALILLPGCPSSSDTPDAPGGTDAPAGADVPATVDAPELDAPVIADAGSDAPTDDAPGACDAQDAQGMGACDLVLGVAWLGSYCGTLSGCTCTGADCDALYADLTACQEAHRNCPRFCGGKTPFGSPGCLPDEFCDYALADMCGAADGTGECTARPTECLEPGGVPVCGCDGMEYLNECLANMAGTGVGRLGGCP
jgi:hypothetical protein